MLLFGVVLFLIIVNVYSTMATLQGRSRGKHKYWYIVESRRVNGKPRPVVLAYLGKAETLLRRLTDPAGGNLRVKSYSHGSVAALLAAVGQLGIVEIINRHVPPNKRGEKQLRHGLTVGASLVLRTIERVCAPCSNQAFPAWAKTTSLEYLLRICCAKLDSQHFWDQMNELPAEKIPLIEEEIVGRLLETEKIELDTLLLDATNFFTFIATTNRRCRIAQRGKSKQKRRDLRQVGLLLVATRQDIVPLFHETYPGNKADSRVFADCATTLLARLKSLVGDLDQVTLVFDRGNNSKANLSEETLSLHYVGALVPSQHADVLDEARRFFDRQPRPGDPMQPEKMCYRIKRELWGRQRTLLVYRSERLYEGQLRGVLTDLEKRFDQLDALNRRLANPRGAKLRRRQIVEQVETIVKGQFLDGLIDYTVRKPRKGNYVIEHRLDGEALETLKQERLGVRILMTDRHDWTNEQIMDAYHGQAKVEYGFKNLKNPHHLGIRPQFHWTDQKIKVHCFTCVLGLLLASLVHRRARRAGYPETNYDNLLDRLNGIRLATLLEADGKRGRPKATYKLEETDALDDILLDALSIREAHCSRPRIKGLGVYT